MRIETGGELEIVRGQRVFVGEQVDRRAVVGDPAAVEDDCALTDLGGERQVVGDNELGDDPLYARPARSDVILAASPSQEAGRWRIRSTSPLSTTRLTCRTATPSSRTLTSRMPKYV